MRLSTPFTPINPLEEDSFAFEFTADIGGATMVSTAWTCTLSPFQTVTDATPQSHIMSASPQTMIQVRDPLTGALLTKMGFFSVALVGGFLTSQIGATYLLEATLLTSDGRTLALSSTVLCAAP